MANTIKTDYGAGGAQLTPGASGDPSLATVLRGIVDDLAVVKLTACAEPIATTPETTMALANEIRAKITAIAAAVLTTQKG